MTALTCLRPVQSHQRKARKDRGQNLRLPPLPLGKGSIPETVIPVKPQWSYIRNLTITCITPKQLERWLEEQIERHGWALDIQVYWLPINASWLDQIEIWFSILQRKLLQPNHFERLGKLKRTIIEFISYCNETAKPIQWSYTVDKLEQKLGAH